MPSGGCPAHKNRSGQVLGKLDGNERGFARILVVMETIIRVGPINLDAMVAETGISRTAAFRVLKNLEEFGWIRPQLGTGAYTITAKYVAKIRQAHRTYEEIDVLLPTLKMMAKDHKLHFDICVLEDLVVPRIVESTRRNKLSEQESFFQSPFVISALSAADPRMRLMVLKNAVDSAEEREKSEITSGGMNAKIKKAGQIGYVEDAKTSSVIIPLIGMGAFSGTLKIASGLSNQPGMIVERSI